MRLKLPSKIATTDYVVAPWHLRLRWWCAARFWCWCKSFEELQIDTPDQANPLWRK
ncbi:hypothetical protein [Candidatus Viridilinea mediisalina]|uniref:hypothetical protein n=1 Tax=Candidatus Viridilinea mediisalina TaxID=2024553 RepID=UPI0013FDE308|nr:hypothetical protein [Candidatus Viridilinea mediisalina]